MNEIGMVSTFPIDIMLYIYQENNSWTEKLLCISERFISCSETMELCHFVLFIVFSVLDFSDSNWLVESLQFQKWSYRMEAFESWGKMQ